MRMEKLPSTIVIHKRVDTLDSRLAQMEGELANNPLEKNLGFFDFGKYTTAPQDAAFAFVKINDMWNEPIQAIENSDEEGEAEPEEPEEPMTQQEEAEQEQTEITDNQTATGRPKRKATATDAAPNKRPKITQSKRTRQDDDDPNTPDKRIKRHNIKTTTGYLSTLWKDIQNSRDKMFFIQRHETSRPRAEWHLVQIDLDETNPRLAKATGEYHAKYYIRNYAQAKKRTTRNCKYWPLIRELRPDGNFGAIVMIRPEKVDELLAKKPYSRGWYQREENIATNGLIGPFDFTQIDQESHRIEARHWKELLTLSAEHNIEARDVNKIVPLT
jgi:chemotaxis protein histidine kinase CheA